MVVVIHKLHCKIMLVEHTDCNEYKRRCLTTVPNSLFLVFGRIASITNTTRTVDEMAQLTAADTLPTRAITSVCSIVKLEQFLKGYIIFAQLVSSRDFQLEPTVPKCVSKV